MTTPTDDSTPENQPEDLPRFALETPFGLVTDGKDLPPGMQSVLRARLESGFFPEPVAQALRRFLGEDDTTDGEPRTEHETAEHAPDCTCDDAHRLQVWDILDEAFPQDPHLWQAMAALFTLSAANPTAAGEAERRTALETAGQHLERSLARLDPLSPEEELVERFWKQMGGL